MGTARAIGQYVGLVILLFVSFTSQAQKSSKKFPLILEKKDRYIVFPLVVKSPEYKWGGGFGGIGYFKLKKDSVTRTSNVKLVSFATLRKQIVMASEGNIYFPQEQFIIHYIASFTHFPDKFWGLGNDTPNGALENYTIKQFDLYPQVLRELVDHLFVGIGYEYQKVFYFDYDKSVPNLFDSEDIAGRNGSRTSGTGFILTWDSRNNAFSSNHGLYVQYFNNFYRDFLGSQYNFTMQNLDVRKYFDLHKNRSMAFQLNIQHAIGQIPIRNLSIIGSDSFMRGYYAGRYQDKAMFAFQGEYRTPVYKRIGVTLFTGIGKVAPTIEQSLNFSSLKISCGFGLRYAINPKEKLNLRYDNGFGNRTHGSYLNMGEAF